MHVNLQILTPKSIILNLNINLTESKSLGTSGSTTPFASSEQPAINSVRWSWHPISPFAVGTKGFSICPVPTNTDIITLKADENTSVWNYLRFQVWIEHRNVHEREPLHGAIAIIHPYHSDKWCKYILLSPAVNNIFRFERFNNMSKDLYCRVHSMSMSIQLVSIPTLIRSVDKQR